MDWGMSFKMAFIFSFLVQVFFFLLLYSLSYSSWIPECLFTLDKFARHHVVSIIYLQYNGNNFYMCACILSYA